MYDWAGWGKRHRGRKRSFLESEKHKDAKKISGRKEKTLEDSVQSFLHFILEEKRKFSDKRMSGPQCCENPPSLEPSSGVGHVQEFGGLSSYVNCPSGSKSAVLFVSDIFDIFCLPLTQFPFQLS
ncbi:hypothetical protein LIER_30903 [Lithospermum erythrorhizon]|uniref:Uncharacterized protein n=1 Tax=Lithospermum erythrorhizon TaxID=34254 RepID=A0AAV3RV45_LITER